MHGRAAFPEAGVVVILRDLLEAELLVVIGADPLGRIDRAFFQRGINVAARELLRHDANFLQHLTGNTADAEFQSGKIGNGLDLLAEPAAHLGASVAAGKSDHAELLEELIAKLLTSALIPPGILHARVQAERHRSVDLESRILADIVIRDGMAEFDGAVRGSVKSLKTGNNFAGRKNLDLKFVVGHLGDVFGELGGTVVDRVERLRKT